MNKQRWLGLLRVEGEMMITELIKIAQEARIHLLSLPNRGEFVCNTYISYIPSGGMEICRTCGTDKYTHLCKRILAIGFEYK